jgi:hypothetical protein
MIGAMSMIPPARPPRRQPRPTPQPVEPTQSPLDSLGRNYLRGSEQQIKRQADEGRGVLNFLNPAPSLTSAVAEGRAPRAADVAMDAGLFAAGLIPFGGPAIRAGGQAARNNSLMRAINQQPKAIETAATQAKRVTDRDVLLNELGPQAIYEFLQSPVTGYRNTLNAPTLRQFFSETSERIPKGTEMYRAPSKGQVESRLPRTPGEFYEPGQVMSAAGSADLQKLGEVLGGKKLGDLTGGNQHYAPGLMRIEAMEDLPGIPNINSYLSRYAGQYGGRGRGPIAGNSDFVSESTLGPTIRYLLQRFEPGAGDVPPTWYFNAYNR